MSLLKRLTASRTFQKVIARVAVEYLKLVWKTNRFVAEPADAYERFRSHVPVILAMWHGQHFLSPFVRHGHRAKVLVSRHRDGEINAIVAEHFGVGTIRGSGAHGREVQRKRGIAAFREMLAALDEGYNMALTADVPKISRVAGLGVVKLAAASGRPICVVAIATSRRITLKNWDRTTLHLPFGRGVVVVGEPIHVAADADGAALEGARTTVESALNAATARAYEIVGSSRRRRS
jgi:lysophospholipid acyltransferase (LPLAT)-like uncharacterized protein